MEAQDAAPRIAAQRDTQWDNREAVFFLRDEDHNELFSPLARDADTYFLSTGSNSTGENFYGLNSRYDRRWLPSASATPAMPPSDSEEFLLEAPGTESTPATITLGKLKTRVAAVNAELNGGDGTEAYKDCIRAKYKMQREDYSREGQGLIKNFTPLLPDSFASGQAAGTQLFKYRDGFVHPAEKKEKFWLDGKDSVLFSTSEGPHRVNMDWNGDGQPDDGFLFDQNVVSARPLPRGAYTFNTNLIIWLLLACGHTYTYEVTANVTAPDGVLHEAFYDPVAIGNVVVADARNGVLKPAAFADANGGSATIGGIAWQAGTVKVEVTPDNALAGQVLDFIELDGTMSLSLDVADATVDSANDTLSWSVASQPWEDGDLLMVRMREAR